MQRSMGLKQPWKNQVTVGSIEIRVISKPKVKLKQLEGVLKSKTKSKKSSTELIRELRRKDYEREEKRIGSG